MGYSKKIILRIFSTFSVLLIVVIGLFIFIIKKNEIKEFNKRIHQTEKNTVELKDTERIPKNAFWIEKNKKGNWFHVDWMHNHMNIVIISIYDKSGELLDKSKFLKICPADKLKFIEDLKMEIDFYDGENIQLKDNCYLLKKEKLAINANPPAGRAGKN